MCVPDTNPPSEPYQTRQHLLPSARGQSLLEAQATNAGELVIEEFPLSYNGYTYTHSRIAYVTGRGPVPVVLVYPNYAGLKQFDVDVAAFLARCGYVGLAVDLYKDVPGEYTFADRNPHRDASADIIKRHRSGSSRAMDDLLRAPKDWRVLMHAYLAAAFAHLAVSDGLAGAIGYCLGGQCVLEHVRAGHLLQAVVSFHGVYHSRPRHAKEDRRLTKEEFEGEVDLAVDAYGSACRVLVEHGDHDTRDGRDGASIAAWKEEMDAVGVDWRFNNHARTPHGFALAPGVWSNAYTESSDRRSTLAMLSLFSETWPAFPQYAVEANACGTVLGQHFVSRSRL